MEGVIENSSYKAKVFKANLDKLIKENQNEGFDPVATGPPLEKVEEPTLKMSNLLEKLKTVILSKINVDPHHWKMTQCILNRRL